MSQQPLFDLDQAIVTPRPDVRLDPETHNDSLSRMADKRRIRRLSTIADKLQHAADPVDRAKLATQARDLAEALVEETILDANRAGITWRELGAGLGIPFQTLYRRYGRGT
jgi:hypothetical protein